MIECRIVDVYNPDGDGKNHAWIVCPDKKFGIYSREGRADAIREMKEALHHQDFVVTNRK